MKHCVDPQVEIDNSGDSNLAIDNKSGNMCSSEITYYCDNPCYEVSRPFVYFGYIFVNRILIRKTH